MAYKTDVKAIEKLVASTKGRDLDLTDLSYTELKLNDGVEWIYSLPDVGLDWPAEGDEWIVASYNGFAFEYYKNYDL